MDLALRPVAQTDWPWIQHWFRDPWLDRELGPMDRAWLIHVLQDKGGAQLVAEASGEPAALIGVKWAVHGHPYHVVTDLAVAPSRRRQGVGRAVLAATMDWEGHPSTNEWRANVAKENKPPARLLAKEGWSEIGGKDGMRVFKKTAEIGPDHTKSGSDNSA